MSTRIYQGFRLATDSLAEALRLIDEFRPWVTKQAEARLDAFICAQAPSGQSEKIAMREWRSRRALSRKEGCRDPVVDTDFSIALIPAHGGMLGIVYTEHHDWYTAWCAQAGVEEFSYWNNADEPDGITAADWAARKQAWDVLSGLPVSMQAFTIDLMSPSGPCPKAWRT